MQSGDWFENWFGSYYYKLLYADRDELEAKSFLDVLIDYIQPLPDSRMLDIACGDGRYTIQLAQKGFDATGIDISVSSIDRASKSENERTHFFVHDMRFPFYINYFDYAFNFFTSFGYFQKQRDHTMAASSFASALRKDGLLIIDYLNVQYVLPNIVQEQTVTRGDIDFMIKKSVKDNYIIKDISFRDNEGRERIYRENVATFGLSDFIDMFRPTGLSLVGTFGNYKLETYDPLSSPRLIMIFKKIAYASPT